jgi:hypothetical protein
MSNTNNDFDDETMAVVVKILATWILNWVLRPVSYSLHLKVTCLQVVNDPTRYALERNLRSLRAPCPVRG